MNHSKNRQVVRIPALLLSLVAALTALAATPSCATSETASGICDEGLTTCGGVCVDLMAAVGHCGACDNACAEGQVCEGGACGEACAAGTTRCGASCVDTDSDRENCGGCNVLCPLNTTCSSGACIATCPGTLTECGGQCVDTQTSLIHCGACDIACADGEACQSGACVSPCGPNQAYCQGACVSTQSNPQNCGGCGVTCSPGEACIGGSCQGGGTCDNTGRCGDIASGCPGCALSGPCSGQYNACSQSTDCLNFNDCAYQCFDQACFDNCVAAYPAGAALYNDLSNCLFCVECYFDCDGAGFGCP